MARSCEFQNGVLPHNRRGGGLCATQCNPTRSAHIYNATGNLITTTDPLGNQTQRVYDAVSRLTALIDPKGLQTQFRYDALNRVTELADARQGITRFSYDPNGNLLTVTDAKNQSTTYTYDAMDRLATRKDALNRMESYQYDLAGNLTQFTDRKNQVTTFQYDALNRRIGGNYAGGISTAFIYDTVGRLAKATDSITGTIQFEYDNLNRLIREISSQGTVESTYDVLGRRSMMTANGATPINYSYDAASRLIQVIQAGLIVGLGYDNANRRTNMAYPNGTSTSYTYDVASRLTTISHTGPSGGIDSLTYLYDATGNRIAATRITGSASTLPAAVQAGYNAANEQIQFNSPSPNQSFDAIGSLTTDGIITYTWDSRRQLTALTGPGLSATFHYDALGRRISKTINSVTTNYVYDRNDIVQEIGGGAVIARYVRSPRIDEPFVRQTMTGNEFYHGDALGSTLDLTNQAGAVQARYTYEAFGKTTIEGTSSNPFQYTGRENDGTGLYYYRARYLNPMTGRFIQQDPIGFAGGDLNVYAYVGNNPVLFRDELGLQATCVYSQSSGRLICTCNGNVIVDLYTYSGHGSCINDPFCAGVKSYGAVPQGVYEIGGQRRFTPEGSQKKIPGLPLTALGGTNTFGRDGFYLHGGSDGDTLPSRTPQPIDPGDLTASKGCVIVNRDERNKIRDCDAGAGGKNLFLVTP